MPDFDVLNALSWNTYFPFDDGGDIRFELFAALRVGVVARCVGEADGRCIVDVGLDEGNACSHQQVAIIVVGHAVGAGNEVGGGGQVDICLDIEHLPAEVVEAHAAVPSSCFDRSDDTHRCLVGEQAHLHLGMWRQPQFQYRRGEHREACTAAQRSGNLVGEVGVDEVEQVEAVAATEEVWAVTVWGKAISAAISRDMQVVRIMSVCVIRDYKVTIFVGSLYRMNKKSV